LNFEEIRKYLPGDDIRQIDWKVTARTRQPHARVYTEERELPVILLVDQRIGMFFGSQLNLKSVTACEVAALAAWRTIAAKDRVGAVIFNDHEVADMRPQRTRSTVLRILNKLVEMNQALRANSNIPANPARLNEALQRVRRLAKHDCLIVIITDGSGDNEQTQQLVTEIARHNDVLVAFVFDPVEADLPEVAQLVVSDGARQLQVDGRSSGLRTRYREEFAQRRQAARQYLITREVPVLPLSAAEPTIDQLARALGRPARSLSKGP
jgi:uncharacterized protein (DUF58 family)